MRRRASWVAMERDAASVAYVAGKAIFVATTAVERYHSKRGNAEVRCLKSAKLRQKK